MTEAKTHKEEPQPTDQPQNSEAQQGPARKESSDFLSHRKTFVGTAQYVSPEMLEHSECDTAADLWALGIYLEFSIIITLLRLYGVCYGCWALSI